MASSRSKVLRMEWPPVELAIQPAEHAQLSGAESFHPAVDQKVLSRRRSGYFPGFVNHGPSAASVEVVSRGYFLRGLGRLIERVQQLANPGVQVTFAGMASDRLKDADGQTIFSAIEMEYIFTGLTA